MIEALIRHCLAHRGLVLAAAVLLAAGSLISVRGLTLDAIPDLSDPQVVLRASWPGQSPAMVEEQLTWKFSVIVTLAPFPSLVTAKWVKENLSDSRIPQSVFDRLDSAGDAEAEGIALCAETMRAVADIPGVSGIHLMTMGAADPLKAAIEASGLR